MMIVVDMTSASDMTTVFNMTTASGMTTARVVTTIYEGIGRRSRHIVVTTLAVVMVAGGMAMKHGISFLP